MNSHLNIYKFYTKEDREYQLENDLTRALAITMQEDNLFFYEILREIMGTELVSSIFSHTETDNFFDISIQVNSKHINDFEKIIAVSLTENEMSVERFWKSKNLSEYDPICDIVIRLRNIVVIIEAKRNAVDCTEQLFNQTYNVVLRENHNSSNGKIEISSVDILEKMKIKVLPIDLNWKKLLVMATKILSFQKTVGNLNRFTADFVSLVTGHNPGWLPEVSISELGMSDNSQIVRRISSSINSLDIQSIYEKLPYNDRLGLKFDKSWAQEIIFNVSDMGELVATVYPGNTKTQGYHIFGNDVKIAENINIGSLNLEVEKNYHIKLTSFQKYFTGLWFSDDDLIEKNLYSLSNFTKYSGRKCRGKDWSDIELLFDSHFAIEFNWREKISWEKQILKSGKSQFDLSFGYELSVYIPFDELKKIDSVRSNIEGLNYLIITICKSFENDLIS